MPRVNRERRLESLRIGFIGAGRVATALASALAIRGLKVVSIASLRAASAERVAAAIAGCRASPPQQAVDETDLVFLTTPDQAIEATAAQLRWRQGVSVVHCSGAIEVASLAHAAREGASIGGFHPLQSFADPAAAVRSLPGCTITIEADAPLDETLAALAARLDCRVNRLPPGMRPRYHAAAGYASQFVNALLFEASTIWQTWGAREEDAVRALLPLVRGTIASIESVGIASGMPGPVSRGDVATVAKHVAALGAMGPDRIALYRALSERSIALALECGAIDAETAGRLRTTLIAQGVAPPARCSATDLPPAR